MIACLSIGQYLHEENCISTTKQFVTTHKLPNMVRHDPFAVQQQKERAPQRPLPMKP
jgi:hypothetical protein